MKTEEFNQIEKDALEMGAIAKKEYVEKGALSNLNAAARVYNLAVRAAIAELMYKNNPKNK